MALPEPLRWFFFLYFILHIPITICVDSFMFPILQQFVEFPEQCRQLTIYHFTTNEDFLVRDTPVWLKSFIACELGYQLPFFFVAAHALFWRNNWIRVPMIIYGAHVATTMVPILTEFLVAPINEIEEDDSFSSEEKRWSLVSIYLPWLVIALMLVIVFSLDAEPFPKKVKRS